MDEQLAHHYDRIKAALDAQERRRQAPDFPTWVARALPVFIEHVVAVREAEQLSPGHVLLTWHDWMALRGYARRGRIYWTPTGRGPLHFTPPNLEQLAERFAFECRQRGIALPRRQSNEPAPVVPSSEQRQLALRGHARPSARPAARRGRQPRAHAAVR